MKINIKGNNIINLNEYYVQTFSLLFFPEDNIFGRNNKTDNFINITADISENKIFLKLLISYEKKSSESAKGYEISNNTNTNIKKQTQLSFGDIFYETAGGLLNYFPAWGIHTGIRPSLFAGQVYDDIKEYNKTIDILTQKYKLNINKAKLALDTYINAKELITKDKNKTNENNFSLYVSIPFCPSRCRYCSFVSFSAPNHLKLIPPYLEKLKDEIRIYKKIAEEKNLKIKSFYIGGGTPSVLDDTQTDSLLDMIYNSFDTSELIETTFEAGRADTITKRKLDILKKYKINRISINPQTTNNDTLQHIGRNHTAEDFYRAFCLAREAGIEKINTDIIIGLENETKETMLKTAEDIINLSPENITVHTLCVKRSSDIKVQISRNELSSDFLYRNNSYLFETMESITKMIHKNGYFPYYLYKQKYTLGNLENIGFAKKGTECIYNIYMMDEIQTIFGAGAGASTKIVNSGKIERKVNNKYPFEYLQN